MDTSAGHIASWGAAVDGLQSMFADVGSDDLVFVRYVCAQCDFTGPVGFGPVAALGDERDQAETLFFATAYCQLDADGLTSTSDALREMA